MSDAERPSREATAPDARPSRARRAWRLGILGAVVVVLGAVVLVGGTEYYTSRPQFCGSCHVMNPYYESWSNDIHSSNGTAWCVDCHYAPGEQHTLMAKFRGISQVASYFSGRYGTARPRAHVRNDSCLTSGCHGGMSFMDREIRFGNVLFSHALHLDPNSERLRQHQEELEAVRSALANELPADQIEELTGLVSRISRAIVRTKEIEDWIAARGLSALRSRILEYADLVHMEVRIEQLRGLTCISCHEFDDSLENHFAVARTTCYTCHFINQPFNGGTGRCLKCHEPPQGEVAVHFPAGQATDGRLRNEEMVVTMDHTRIVANNVDCVSCHADLIEGTGEVTRQECTACHDQEHYYRDFNNLTTEVVRHYHRAHTPGQHARCTDCHSVIQHRLVRLEDPSDAAALLRPVRNDCQHCHPDHHREQVQLLIGQGGYVEGAPPVPGPMSIARANCRACHILPTTDEKGDFLLKASPESCRGCHGEEYRTLFQQWRNAISSRLTEAQNLLSEVRAQLAQPAPGVDRRTPEELVARAAANIRLVAVGNGIHNKNYALNLLDQAILDLTEAQHLLSPGVSRSGGPQTR